MKQNKSNNTIFKNWRGKLSNSEQKRKRTGGRRKKNEERIEGQEEERIWTRSTNRNGE